jgi:signal transduction histidine kinase
MRLQPTVLVSPRHRAAIPDRSLCRVELSLDGGGERGAERGRPDSSYRAARRRACGLIAPDNALEARTTFGTSILFDVLVASLSQLMLANGACCRAELAAGTQQGHGSREAIEIRFVHAMIAPPHHREDARLRKLDECEILDTPPEDVFDRIAHMAGQLCDCPIAAVNLIDRERQWFKAAIGTDLRSTSRDIAFCAHTVAKGAPIVVSDVSLDPRFCDYPLVLGEPKLRFYAAVPVCVDALPVGTLCVFDVTSRTLSPAQRDAFGDLAREVESQLELRRALLRSQRLGEQRLQLGCMVVHDMRAPLTVVLTGAECLAAGDRLSREDRSLLAEMISATVTLERMMRDLLDVSRSETGDLEPQNELLPVEELAARIQHLLRPFAVDRRLVMRSTFPSGTAVTLDANLFARVVENLVANAFKYAPGESEITTVLSLSGAGLLRVVVSDQGPGIPADAREKIFDCSYRLTRDASIQPRTSYGLGLNFCKLATTAMGGRVWVEDNSPAGARFIAEIPADGDR